MGQLIAITTAPVRIDATGGAEWQELRLARDVSAFDELDLLLSVYEAASAVTIKMYTGQQIQTDDGWVAVGEFGTSGISANSSAKLNVTNLLRYVRFKVETTIVTTFMITGVGRTWS